MSASSSNPRGAFIVIEGLDRSGKTTQVKLLKVELLQTNHKVQLLRFPNRTTPIGQMIDAYLKSESRLDDHVIHLLFSANRWEHAPLIRSLIAEGNTVLCDRYTHSGMIYSAAKNNPLLNLAWAHAPDVGLPEPDIVVYLDVSPEVAASRGGYGDEVYEKREMQARVRELFLREATQDEAKGAMVVVDAGKSVDAVGEEVWGVVKGVVESVERGERGLKVGTVKGYT